MELVAHYSRWLGGSEELKACDGLLSRARKRAFLPSRLGGVGLRSWDRTAGFAWFCSVASCVGLDDMDFDFARRFLKQQSAGAYSLALESIGGPSYLEQSKLELIPIGEPEVLSDSTFFKDLFAGGTKAQAAALRDPAAFMKFGLDHASTSEKIVLASMKDPGLSRRMFASQR